MISAYYKFEILSDKLKAINKIKSKARLDCTAYNDKVIDGYKGLTNFVNFKGQLFVYKTPCRNFLNTDSKRIAEWSLTNGNLNLTSIYIEDIDFPNIGFGYPNANRTLSNGNSNPQFHIRNDGYLFLINSDYTIIELFIIQNGRNLIGSYYQKMIDGHFEDEIKELRIQAKQFFYYESDELAL